MTPPADAILPLFTAYDDIKELLGTERQKTGMDAFYDALLRLKLAIRTGMTGS